MDKKRASIFVLTAVAAVAGFIIGGEVIRVIYTKEMRNIASAKKNAVAQREMPKEYAPISGVPDPHHEWFTGFPEGRVLEGRRENAIVRAARRVAPSVVGIVVTQQIEVVQQPPQSDYFNFFFGQQDTRRVPHMHRQIENIGSGFVIHKDGMILTNYHVVRNAVRLYISFPDGIRVEGYIVGVDEKSDIAVIAPVSPTGVYKPVEFGNSDDCLVGEWSIALGNPFLHFINDAFPTLTLGVISAVNRDFAPSKGVYYRNMLQTDAPINPGNSGGPLLNANAEVIGVNSFIYTGSALNTGSVGMGFAIPINRARRVAEELITYGHRRQVWTGLVVSDITPALSAALNYDGDGVAVMSIIRHSPGDLAGIKPGDIIRSIDDRMIHDSSVLDGFFLDYFAGDTADVQFVRGGKPLTSKLILKEIPAKK